MKLSSIPLDLEKAVQGAMIVGDGKVYYDYEEGVKKDTGGYAYDVLAPMLEYTKILVKVPGELKSSIQYVGKPIPVIFEGISGRAYQDYRKGTIELSVTAERISIADKTGIRLNGKGE